jgi:hypothetical protein
MSLTAAILFTAFVLGVAVPLQVRALRSGLANGYYRDKQPLNYWSAIAAFGLLICSCAMLLAMHAQDIAALITP